MEANQVTAAVKAAFDHVAVKAAAICFANSEIMADDAVKSLAVILGTAPTFTLWGLISVAFQTEYKAAKKVNDEAAARGWQRLAARMNKDFGLSKPKAPSENSKAHAAVRTKIDKAIKALVVKHKTVAALQRQAGQALEAGKPEDAEVLMAASKVAAKDETKAKVEAQAKRWMKVADAVKAAKKAHDERILNAIEKAIALLVPKVAGKK
jgi:hypothetical protein